MSTEKLQREGWTLHRSRVEASEIQRLRETVFTMGQAGSRCLLDLEAVQSMARQLRSELAATGLLPDGALAIQAIAFDKTPDTNWKVAWHQDLMFPFARPVQSEGYELAVRKGGVDFARPPVEVLEQLLAVRVHLDDCDIGNGPLRVAPGSHRQGIIPSAECAAEAGRRGEQICLAAEGEALLMRPLLLHASSQASSPRHRRVLHFVYHAGSGMPEEWHRKI